MTVESLSQWFAARGIPPLLAGALLALVFLLVWKTIFRPRSEREAGVPSALDTRLRAGGSKKVKISSTTHELPAEVSGQVLQLIQEGQKINAIKLVREATGLGLKESKDIVDGLASAFGK